jgi:hypothetical protein
MPDRRPLPRWATEIARGVEPLWIGATATLFIAWGYALIPTAIRMLGRSGRMETIEWGVYMSLLVGFPVVCILIALALPRFFRGEAATVAKTFAIVVAFFLGITFIADGRLALAAIALIPAVITALLSAGAYKVLSERPLEGIIALAVLGVVALIAWMTAGGLVYWTGATGWFLGSPWRFLAMAVAVAVSITGLPRFGESIESKAAPGVAFRIATVVLLLALIVFSFRTNPVVEFYHWGFWTGPIEQLRQGGWLLHDTPSQYGFLSILIPAIMPGSAWISFWYYQAAIYAVVGVIMFVIFRRLRGGVGNLALAFLVVATTLFFRPRTESLILPAQMTPSGGPVRFLWCFVLLGWLLLVFRDHAGHKERTVHTIGAGFPLVGHLIWICSIAWSFEAAIYSSAIWFSAFTVYLVQRRTNIIRSLLVPAAMLAGLYGFVWVAYRVGLGAPPNLAGYSEFGLLYSRGFGALPVAAHGPVWYLILVFMIASTAVVQFLVEDWRDFRLVVAAGVWGGVWSLSSYFVSRSHPVNLLSLAPVLLFAVAVLMIVIRHSPRRAWHGYVRAATVPVFAIPIAMTLGHPGLGADLRTPQLAPSRFNDQLPLMDAGLESLLRDTGAKPDDPVVRIVDGRLLLEAWRGPDSTKVMSNRSWLPKPFEIISSLPAPRRQEYIDRSARTGTGGWMVHHATDTIANFKDRVSEIERAYRIGNPVTSGAWTVWRVQPRNSRKL